ncbi:MAG: SpoIIE family protein phosphatase [Phycisphaerales bacterium]|nr:SpoIIE family protein phosphatase [Phycisphaerales bacterium]
MAQLRYLDEHNALHTRALGPEKFLIGRVESCEVILNDDLVSREHARLDRDPDGRFRIRDLGSRNKTFVNGEMISETLLNHGDMVRIGNRVFEFLDDSFNESPADLSFFTPDRGDPAGTQWIKIKMPVSLAVERIGGLAAIAADVPYPARAEDVASAALARLMLLVRAERGLVALRADKKKELRIVAQRGLRKDPGANVTPVSQTFVYSALLQSVAGRYPQENGQIQGDAGFAAAGMVAPLMHENQVIGVVYVDRPKTAQAFTDATLHEMTAAGAVIGSLMADATRRLSDAVKSISAPWVATLRRMQRALAVPVEGNKTYDIAMRVISGAARCGDFCDVIHVSDTRTYVLMVDAGGQGVLGLAQATGVRTAVGSALAVQPEGVDLPKLITAINQICATRHARQLVTCLIACIDATDGRVTYINAGGPPPLLMAGAGRLITLDQPALLLGIDPQFGYEETVADLPSKFRLLFHSDGVDGTCNASGEALGHQRVHDLLLNQTGFPPALELVNQVMQACERHRGERPQEDDALVLAVGHG